MKIQSLQFRSIRGFREQTAIDLSEKINIFVGQNNAGKSTVLNIARLIQDRESVAISDISIRQDTAKIDIYLSEVDEYLKDHGTSAIKKPHLTRVNMHWDRTANKFERRLLTPAGDAQGNFDAFPSLEPKNAIYPYLSKRKVVQFNESINFESTNSVKGNLENLFAKINRLSNFGHPKSNEYREYCEEILGFAPNSVASLNGQTAGYQISSFESIQLTSMGEGVTSLLGLIVDLCLAEKKVFIIEEMENDIHPKALKALLRLITIKSQTNQFLISTHSNIVVKQLGGLTDSKVFRVYAKYDEDKLPQSYVEEVGDTPDERIQLLEELGYEFLDTNQWKAWLILEESSAEAVIREVLIPNFVPKLSGILRTYSANGRNQVKKRFNDLKNLLVFVHLEEIYKNRAWVIIDAGEEEEEIIEDLRRTFGPGGWEPDNFMQFSNHEFEEYYPKQFAEEASQIKEEVNTTIKRALKSALIEKVMDWAVNNPEQAKEQFAESANEVIEILNQISRKLER